MHTEKIQDLARSRQAVYAELRKMPPLSHWPDRNLKFSRARSEVLRHIVSLFPRFLPHAALISRSGQYFEAHCILTDARNLRSAPVLFHEPRRLWYGADYEAEEDDYE